MSKRRVVVTGLGMVTALGNTVDSTWKGILEGRSGVGRITTFDPTDFTVQIAALLKDFPVEEYLSGKDARKMDRFIQYGLAAAYQAMADCGLEVTEENSQRIGVAIGSGIGGLECLENNNETRLNRGPRKISPFFIPATIINMIGGHVAIKYGLRGPNVALVSACTTGTHNIGFAVREIVYGDADVMLAGGAEGASTPLGVGGFAAMKALSTRNDDPERASRPFDRERDGFVLGDGAGVLVLEEYEHAKRRGATIYGEVIGFGMSDDAFHMTMPDENARGAVDCMTNALKDAGLNVSDIDYINAHGTSTPANDKLESLAINKVFGPKAKEIAVSSTKSMIGHTLGAAGAIELILSLLAIRDQVAPPTINLENPDPECDLDYVPHTAREMKIERVMSNSFGFGGTNGTLIASKV